MASRSFRWTRMRPEILLNGVSLADLDPAVRVRAVRFLPTLSAPSLSLAEGAAALPERVGENHVLVSFALEEPDPEGRQEALRRVMAWAAGGGWLSVSCRAGERLHVRLAAWPECGAAWTDALTLDFAAAFPYWEGTAHTLTLSGTAGTGQLSAGGCFPSYVSVSLTAREPVNTLNLTAGETVMGFTALGLAAGEGLTIGYDDGHRLTVKKGSASLYGNRLGVSDDDLRLPGGSGTVGFTADGAVTLTFETRRLTL